MKIRGDLSVITLCAFYKTTAGLGMTDSLDSGGRFGWKSVFVRLGSNRSERGLQGHMAPLCQSSVYGNTFVRPSESLTDVDLKDMLKICFNQCLVK